MIDEKVYYQISRQASREVEAPVMKRLLKWSKDKKKILDLGCGDGTRLSMVTQGKERTGIDLSAYAISEGKKNYPSLRFVKGDVEKLIFADNQFDFVYSMFILEHLKNPEKMIKEAIRVLKREGIMFLAAPNYGAPHRRSPCFKGNRYLKLLKGFFLDFWLVFSKTNRLSWPQVKPRNNEPYQIDFDTVCEPYLLSLVKYLRDLGMDIKEISSLWEVNEINNSFLFRVLKQFGRMGFFPFKYWGPQILVVARKIN